MVHPAPVADRFFFHAGVLVPVFLPGGQPVIPSPENAEIYFESPDKKDEPGRFFMSSPSKNIPAKRTGSPGKSKFSRHVATTIYLATILAVLGFLFQSLRTVFLGH